MNSQAQLHSNYDEQSRQVTLEHLGLHGQTDDPFYGNIVLLASILCETPYAAFSLLSQKQQFFKAALGFSVMTVTSKADSFCGHTVLQPDVMIIPDASVDVRFKSNSFVRGTANIRFYAGVSVVGADGKAIGSVCVLDVMARGLREEQREGLKLLSESLSIFISAASSSRRGLGSEAGAVGDGGCRAGLVAPIGPKHFV